MMQMIEATRTPASYMYFGNPLGMILKIASSITLAAMPARMITTTQRLPFNVGAIIL
jgi:hypothetical protein